MVLLPLLVALPCSASTYSNWVSNETRAFLESYTEALSAEKGYRSTFEIGNIDPRLNLHPCEMPASFSFQSDPMSQNKNTIKVVCNDQKRWSIFVSAKINIYKDVWVASQTLTRNHRVTNADLEKAEIQINQKQQGYFANKKNLLGMLLRRSIQAGRPFYPGLLLPPKIIARGDSVVISALSETISVQMMGTALSDGKLGQQISVKNKKSQRVIRGTVVAKGQVTVPM